MRKNFLYLIVFVNISLLMFFLSSFKTSQNKASYQHMLILVQDSKCGEVSIVIDGKQHSIRHFHKETKGRWDLNPVINLIHQYEAEGWELQSFNGGGEVYSFWLRREK